MPSILVKVAVTLIAAASIVSCSSANDTAKESSTTSTTTSAEAPSDTAAKINPNTASTAELAAAFESAGISNPEKWADEVSEYGPYQPETIEATLTKELGKYGIDDATLRSILNVLDPS